MQSFISTETMILLSFLCKKMPNLRKQIAQYTSTPGKKEEDLATARVSPQKIKEARLHPSTILLQTLATAAIIQNALDTTDQKIKELLEQRTAIESALVDLLANNKT